MVTAIDTAILAITQKKAASWTIDGVTYTAIDVDKLQGLRAYYDNLAGQDNATSNSTAPFGITGLKAGSGK